VLVDLQILTHRSIIVNAMINTSDETRRLII